jgi:hypothetical protein
MIQSKPVLLAALVNLIAIAFIPRIFANPTNIKLVDDLVSFLRQQRVNLVTSTVYACLLIIGVEYAMEYTEGVQSPLSGPLSALTGGPGSAV